MTENQEPGQPVNTDGESMDEEEVKPSETQNSEPCVKEGTVQDSAVAKSVSGMADKMKETANALSEKKEAFQNSDQFSDAKDKAGGIWNVMLDSPLVGKIANSKIGAFLYGFGPLKSFANGRYPENESRARGLSSIIGVYLLAMLLCLPLVLLMPSATQSGASKGKSTSSTSKSKKRRRRSRKRTKKKKAEYNEACVSRCRSQPKGRQVLCIMGCRK